MLNFVLTKHQSCTSVMVAYLSSMTYFKIICLGRTIKITKKLKKNCSNTDHFIFHYMFILESFVTSQHRDALLLQIHKHVYFTFLCHELTLFTSIKYSAKVLIFVKMSDVMKSDPKMLPHASHRWSPYVKLSCNVTHAYDFLLILFMHIK